LDGQPGGAIAVEASHLARVFERKPGAPRFDPIKERFELFLELSGARYHPDLHP